MVTYHCNNKTLLMDKRFRYVEEHIMASHQGMTATAEHATGVEDKTYNLVSVLYHALQGGETSMQYLHDAEQAGDQEMVQFFQEVQECQRHLASRAREMLMQRMREGNGHAWMEQGKGHESQRAAGGASAHGHGMAGERGAGQHAHSSRDRK